MRTKQVPEMSHFTRYALLLVLGFSAVAAPDTPAVNLTSEEHGDVFMARKMYREAIEAYREGETKAADKAILEDKIGIAWHQLGDMSAALKSYQRAVKFDPKY